MYAIQADNIIKHYKNGVQALDGLTISVKTGEIFSLLGQNGAGKSTLIKILTTFIKPTSGHITMFGKDMWTQADALRYQIACVSQQTSIDTYLSLEENMMFQSRLYKIPKAEARKKMEMLIQDFGLAQYRKYPVSSYSGGVKRRLDIALTMMSNPKILFLDEPTVGMDIQSRKSMWEMMKKIRNDFGTTIFLTTHYLEEADQLSDTICIMKEGKAIIQGAPFELRSYLHQDRIQVQFSSKEIAKEYLSPIKEYIAQSDITLRDACILINTQEKQSDLANLTMFLLEQHIPFHGIEIVQPTIEDVFLRLTSQQIQEDM